MKMIKGVASLTGGEGPLNSLKMVSWMQSCVREGVLLGGLFTDIK